MLPRATLRAVAEAAGRMAGGIEQGSSLAATANKAHDGGEAYCWSQSEGLRLRDVPFMCVRERGGRGTTLATIKHHYHL